MSQKIKQIVAPLGNETGLTEDGFLASGIARGTQYVVLNERTGQTVPLQRRTPTIPGRRKPSKRSRSVIPVLSHRLKSGSAFYVSWPYINDDALDIDISAALIEQIDTSPTWRAYCGYRDREWFPFTSTMCTETQYAIWLNQDDTFGDESTTDMGDVSFAFNERIWVTFEKLPEKKDFAILLFGHIYSSHDYHSVCPDNYWSQLPSYLTSDIIFRRRQGRVVTQCVTPYTSTEGFLFGHWRRQYPQTEGWEWIEQNEEIAGDPIDWLETMYGEMVPYPDEE